MSRWAKLRQWSQLFSEYAAAQAVIQLLGIVAGLWLVQIMPVREYALYTLALSILTFLAVFSDLGISGALLYFRRQTRSAETAFAPYVRAALLLRRALLAVGGIAGLCFMLLVGPELGFGAVELAAVSAVLVAAVWVQVGASIDLLRLRLEASYRGSYWAEICGNATRLLGVAALAAAGAAFAWLAMLAAAAGSLVTSVLAHRRIGALEGPLPAGAKAPPPIAGIVRYVLPTLLSSIYFSIQGPLTVWLSAFFAGTQSIAEVGALGRLGLIFSLLSGFMGTVLIPRLAAVTDDAHYRRRYLQCWAVLLPFGLGVMLLAALVPDWFLLLLGGAYSGLKEGVLLIAASAVLSAWGGYIIGINNARGWVRHQPLLLVAYALVQVLLIASLDLSTTTGILYFGLWSNAAGLLLQAVVNSVGFVRPVWVAVDGPRGAASRG